MPIAQTGVRKDGRQRSDTGRLESRVSQRHQPRAERGLTRLVGDDNVLPVLLADDLGESVNLAVDDLLGPVRVALLERLADAEDDLNAGLERLRGLVRGAMSRQCYSSGVWLEAWAGRKRDKAHLLGDELVGLVEEGATLRVAEDDPVQADVLQLGEPGEGKRTGTQGSVLRGKASQGNGLGSSLWPPGGVDSRDLAGVGAGGELVGVLGGDRDALAAELLEGEDVEGGRGDDDLGGLDVDLGVVELVDQLGEGGEVAVHCRAE